MPTTVKVVGNQHRVRFLKPYPELEFRQQLTYRVNGWMFIPLVKQGRWDGYISLLKSHSIPTGLYRALKIDLQKAGDCVFEENIVWGAPASPTASGGFSSDRESQNEAIAAMIGSYPVGGGLVLAAMSFGKTALSGLFYSQVAGKHLFVVDQKKLLHQSHKEIALWAQEPVGIVGDGEFKPERITVATAQTLDSVKKMAAFQKWIGDNGSDLSSIIVDEIHTQLNNRSFTIVSELEPKAKFGLTATLSLKDREVFLKAHAFAGPVIYEYSIRQGLDDEILAKVKYVQVRFKPTATAKDMKEYGLDDWYENVVMHPVKNKVLHQLITGYMKRDRYIVVLADKHKHLDHIADTVLSDKRPMLISGKVKKEIQDDYIERFEKGLNRLIVASRVFNKGVSIKRIDVLINVSEMEDADTILQQIGRGLRLHEDKSGVIFVDFGTSTGDYRKTAQARFEAVQAAGIPTQMFDFTKEADEFFENASPAAGV